MSQSPHPAAHLSVQALAEWADSDPNHIHVELLSGGLTNELFVLEHPDESKAPKKILWRQYPSSSDICRETEAMLSGWLGEIGIGPRCFAILPHGRFEEFLDATRLTATDIRQSSVQAWVAQAMADFHMLSPHDSIGVPRDPIIYNRIRNAATTCPQAAPNATQHFLTQASDIVGRSVQWNWIQQEAENLLAALDSVNSPNQFCHNDVQEGNILRHNQTGDLVLIDFEFAGFNPRAYDIANFFLECAIDNFAESAQGFEFDMAHYPSEEQRAEFFKIYLHRQNIPPTEQNVRQLALEVRFFSMASHFWWTLWSVEKHETKAELWGYMEYATTRLGAYLELKGSLQADNLL
eukprot:c17722_g1_i3.p1 GENE.c17722_g1_i3~~c17722_g1_i3.p1  ORF type:complete len:364 (+),score=56.19 c17722_g1_i3:43-1092(+)